MLEVIAVAFTHLVDCGCGFCTAFPRLRSDANQAPFLSRGRIAANLTSSFAFLDCQFRTLEANAAMGSVAERFVHRTTAATERKSSLAREVKLVSAGIDQIDRAFGSLDSIGTVGLYRDFNVSHGFQSSNLAGF